MAVLTVASRANDALILPAMLAAAHVMQNSPHDGIVIEYKDLVSLGKGDEKVILTMDNGEVLVDGSVMPYLLDRSVLPRGAKKSEFGTLVGSNAIQNSENSSNNGVISIIAFSTVFKLACPIPTRVRRPGKYRYREFQNSFEKPPKLSGTTCATSRRVVIFPGGLCFDNELKAFEITHMSPSL